MLLFVRIIHHSIVILLMLSTFVESLKRSGFDIAVPFCGKSVNDCCYAIVQTYNPLVQKRFQLPVMNQNNTLAMLIGIDVVFPQSQEIHANYGPCSSNISLINNMLWIQLLIHWMSCISYHSLYLVIL